MHISSYKSITAQSNRTSHYLKAANINFAIEKILVFCLVPSLLFSLPTLTGQALPCKGGEIARNKKVNVEVL